MKQYVTGKIMGEYFCKIVAVLNGDTKDKSTEIYKIKIYTKKDYHRK